CTSGRAIRRLEPADTGALSMSAVPAHSFDTATELAVPAAAVEAPAARLAPVLPFTPLQRNERLSRRMAGDVWLKREDLQPVRSYKVRGAYNLIAQLDPVARAAGLVCASAGNHAQGVAFACAALQIDGTIFLPRSTPRQKLDRIRTV